MRVPEQCVTLLAIAGARADLHQFVIGQRTVQLGDQRGAQPGMAGQHNGLAIVSESAEVLLLRFSQHVCEFSRKLAPSQFIRA